MNIWTIIAGATGAIALLVAGTMLLPRHVHVEREATLKATPEIIIKLASSNQGYQQFNPFLTADPKLKITHFGPATGIGSGFHFEGKDGKGKQTVAEVTANSVRYHIDLGAMGKPVQTIATKPTATGVHVTWSMDADLGMNPIARGFGLFMDKMIGKTLEQGLINLAAAT